MKTRKQQIVEANFQPQYMLFLLECETEPLPRTEGWKNNIPYMDWTCEFFNKMKEHFGMPTNTPNVWMFRYRDEFLQLQLSKYLTKEGKQ